MKKSLTILLLFLYGFSLTGFSINLYFCCGKLSNIGLTVKQCCPKPSTKKTDDKKGCCECKSFDSSIKDSYLSKDVLMSIYKYSQPVLHTTLAASSPAPAHFPLSKANHYINPPPLAANVSYQLLYCIFRI